MGGVLSTSDSDQSADESLSSHTDKNSSSTSNGNFWYDSDDTTTDDEKETKIAIIRNTL